MDEPVISDAVAINVQCFQLLQCRQRLQAVVSDTVAFKTGFLQVQCF